MVGRIGSECPNEQIRIPHGREDWVSECPNESTPFMVGKNGSKCPNNLKMRRSHLIDIGHTSTAKL